MRVLLMLLPALTAAGCSDKQLAWCETALQSRLKSPGSYKRVSVEKTSIGHNLVFDASNLAGVPVRYTASCFMHQGQLQYLAQGSDGSSFVTESIEQATAAELERDTDNVIDGGNGS